MPYDFDFYAEYAEYLVEPRVRAVHNPILEFVTQRRAFQHVIDLGCGKDNEFYHYGKPANYVGIDANAIPTDGLTRKIIMGDYRDTRWVESLAKEHMPTAAVSLFSTECLAPHPVNFPFYESLFAKTHIEVILVSGFEYDHARGQEQVSEKGGQLISYQSFASDKRHISNIYHETCLEVRCPSTMFGEDVTERWYLLERKEPTRPFPTELARAFAQLGKA